MGGVALALVLTAAPGGAVGVAGAAAGSAQATHRPDVEGGAVLVLLETEHVAGSVPAARAAAAATAEAVDELVDEVVERIEDDGGQVRHELDQLGVVAATVDERTARELADTPGVAAVVPDELLRLAAPARPLPGGGAAPAAAYSPHPVIGSTGAATAWPSAGAGRTVAVLDTGVASGHPAMAGKVVAGRCFSTAQPGLGISAACAGARGSEPCTFSSECGHGTAVAGVAVGAVADSTIDVGGVAPGAGVVAVQVFSRFVDDDECETGCAIAQTSDVLDALGWLAGAARDLNLAAVNLSLGGELNSPACTHQAGAAAVQALTAIGVPVIAAAGNDGHPNAVGWPACLNGVVAVAGTRASSGGWSSPEVANFNAGTKIAVAAPGVGVPVAVAGTTGWGLQSGTSFAAPAVAGAAAAWRAQRPSAALSTFLPSVTSGTVSDTRTGRTYPRLWLPALASTPPPPKPNRAPLLQFEQVVVDGRRVTVTGWALDQDGGKPGVRVTVDGRVAAYLQPAWPRDDVYRFLGRSVDRNSGWGHAMTLTPGTRKVCMQVADPGASNWGSTQCRDVVVK